MDSKMNRHPMAAPRAADRNLGDDGLPDLYQQRAIGRRARLVPESRAIEICEAERVCRRKPVGAETASWRQISVGTETIRSAGKLITKRRLVCERDSIGKPANRICSHCEIRWQLLAILQSWGQLLPVLQTRWQLLAIL